MKKTGILTTLTIVLLFAGAAGQLPEMNNIGWRCVGPAHFGGRVTYVAGIPGNQELIYVGTAAGGLFRSRNAGTTFESIFDGHGTYSVGAIAVAPADPDILYLGTGEGDPRNSVSYGNGIYRSGDAGDTWEYAGLPESERFSEVLIHPDDAETVYAAVMGNAWNESSQRGVYKTTNGGKTWECILFINNTTGCSSLVMHPDNPQVLYAGMYDYLRQPWHFRSGGPGSGLYRSEDGGQSWMRLTDPGLDNGLPGKGLLGRIDVDISLSDPRVIYSMIESEEPGVLWRSQDGGESWTMVSDYRGIASRPFYFNTLWIQPDDPDQIWVLSVSMYFSEDGGKSYRPRGMGSLFGDFHAHWIDPENPDRMINGCDGGAALSYDRGKTWIFLNQIPMAQAYHVGFDYDTPYNVYAGFQDHEIWMGPSRRWAYSGATGGDWTRLRDMADGMHAFGIPGKKGLVIFSGHFGDISRVDRANFEEKFIQPYPVGPSGTSAAYEKYRFNWNSPLYLSAHNPDKLFYGGNVLFCSYDLGDTWRVMSPDLTSADPGKMRLSGGITPDNTRAEYHCTIISISESPVDSNRICVGTDDGNLQLTLDGGENWTRLRIPEIEDAYIVDVDLSRADPDRIYLAIDNHRLGDFSPHLFRSDNLGKTWKPACSGLNGYVHCLMEDPAEPELLFCGTENGMFVSFNEGEGWTFFGHGLPGIPVRDIRLHPVENDLIAATHGRGIYILDDMSWMREWAGKTDGGPKLFPSRPVYRYIPADDRSRMGDAIYRAPNPPYGALVTVYIPPADTADWMIRVYGENDSPLARIPGRKQRGIVRVSWNLGCDLTLTHPELQRDRYGRRLYSPAGKYIIELDAGAYRQRDTLVVLSDPGVKNSPEKVREGFLLSRELALQMNLLDQCYREMESVPDTLPEKERVRELMNKLRSGSRDPDHLNIASRMNWMFNWVRGYSGAPTRAQLEWSEMFIRESKQVMRDWEELKPETE